MSVHPSVQELVQVSALASVLVLPCTHVAVSGHGLCEHALPRSPQDIRRHNRRRRQEWALLLVRR